MKFSFEIDESRSSDVSLSSTGTGAPVAGTEPPSTAIDAGPAPAALVSTLGVENAAVGFVDHRDGGPHSSELLAALAAAGASPISDGNLSTNGGRAGPALDGGSAPT